MAIGEHAVTLWDSLAKAGLVPGAASPLVAEDFIPTTRLEVSFDSKEVTLGNFFRASECNRPPALSFAAEQNVPEASSALILTDPDAPTPDDPKFAFWRHWVLAGLKPSIDGQSCTTDNALTKYLGPGPKDDSKPHRYLFLLYRAPATWQPRETDVGGEEFVQRRSFKPAEFAEAHGLNLVAVNWMTCAGDGWQERAVEL